MSFEVSKKKHILPFIHRVNNHHQDTQSKKTGKPNNLESIWNQENQMTKKDSQNRLWLPKLFRACVRLQVGGRYFSSKRP
jgi:hypothetical protein